VKAGVEHEYFDIVEIAGLSKMGLAGVAQSHFWADWRLRQKNNGFAFLLLDRKALCRQSSWGVRGRR
jgi:hypothetical protein